MSIRKRIFGKSKPGRPPVFSIDPVTFSAAQRVERSGHCSCLGSRGKTGRPSVPNLHVEIQDTSAPGWQALLALISDSKTASVFEPSAVVNAEQWSEIITLPAEIDILSATSQLRLYGSHLRRLPPEIGRLSALTNLDIYTSYSLHWLPYEVVRCTGLRDTRMSTRALYGNIKTRLPFPRLSDALETLRPQTCSVCDEPFGERNAKPFWTTQRIGTDVAPLLAHTCSSECTARIPDAPQGYFARPHKGGGGVGMPDADL
ncbi:hypothetical protein SAMN05518849_101624 [Sphingobium sp. AP50]|nr:hypothetical protein SAMN05518849_101624 [Sphingobium sp. AP50]